MPSDSLSIEIAALGNQRPALPSMWYFSPVAGVPDAAWVLCAYAGAEHATSPKNMKTYRRIVIFVMRISISR